MALANYENFDETTWPDAGPVKTGFVGTAAEFYTPVPQGYEDFDVDKGWINYAEFTDDPADEKFTELSTWHTHPSWGHDLISPTTGLSFSPALFTGSDPEEDFQSYAPPANFAGIGVGTTGEKTTTLSAVQVITSPFAALNNNIIACFAIPSSGSIVSITQTNVIWSPVVASGFTTGVGAAIWHGRATGIAGGTLTVTVSAPTVQFVVSLLQVTNILDPAPVNVIQAQNTSGSVCSTGQFVSSAYGLWIGAHAAATSAMSWLNAEYHVSLTTLQPSISGVVKGAMTYYTGFWTPARMEMRVNTSPAVFGAACGAVFRCV